MIVPIAAPAIVLLALAATSPARAATPAAAPGSPEVIAVIAGANVGGYDDEPLHFAESDARRLRDLLIELGQLRAARALLVIGGGPDQIVQALTEARGRAAELASTGRRVTLLFYFSGHGDDEALHLPAGVLPLRELRQAIARVPADLRVTILDACRTGGRAKGVTRGPAFALTAAPDEPRGTVELRASSLGEAAQESDELAGAIFTHFLISGLRGGADADGDGRVTLAELYSFTYRRTLLRTGSAAVLQHPALQVNLAGAGEVVLTRPSGASAFVEVPRGPDRYLVFAMPSQAAMGELTGEAPGRLALPAGKFLVVRRARNFTGVASVDLSWGGRQVLADADFSPIAREELVARGGQIELRRRRLEAQSGVEFAPQSGEVPALRVGPVLSYARGLLALELEAAYIYGGFRSAEFTGQVHSVAGGPALSIRFHLARVTLAGLVGAELRYSWEHLLRTDADRAAAAGFSTEEKQAFASAGPRAGLRFTVPLGHHLTAGLAATMAGLFRRESNADADRRIAFHPVLSLSAAAGYAF
jgi:hypothetical protein